MKRLSTFTLPTIEPLSPYEWDFRSVTEPMLDEAVRYEYMRSWKWLARSAVKWFGSRVGGSTIRDHFIAANVHGGREYEVIDKLDLWSKTDESLRWFMEFFAEHIAFPAPWVWLIEKQIYKPLPKQKAVYRRHDASVQIQPIKDLDDVRFLGRIVRLQNQEHTPGTYYRLKVHFDSAGIETMVKEFELWLRQEAKLKRGKSVRGKASSKPWHQLKQLAAKRLADAGKTYEEARNIVADHQKRVRIDCPGDVLPVYASQGAWFGAVEAANEELAAVERNPFG